MAHKAEIYLSFIELFLLGFEYSRMALLIVCIVGARRLSQRKWRSEKYEKLKDGFDGNVTK